MAVVAWLGNQPIPGAGGAGYSAYPFSDPIFQSFNVQQYLTVAGVNPATTYAEKAPVEEAPAKTKAGK